MTVLLHETTLELRDRLTLMGVPLPFALKRRDPREPGRKLKEKTEDAIKAAFMAYFNKQKRIIFDTMIRIVPERKTDFGYDVDYYMRSMPDDMYGGDDFIAKIARLLVAGSAQGIDIFAEMINLEMDYTLVNERAAKWAVKYAGNLVGDIDKTTKDTVRRVISDFVKTPGMTVGDVVKRLPYKESRALAIATTETTKTYANAAQMAGEELAKEYPGVKVYKTWFTNNDDRVCQICGPLDGKEVLIDRSFYSPIGGGFPQPPAHVRCRCWMNTTTRIGA